MSRKLTHALGELHNCIDEMKATIADLQKEFRSYHGDRGVKTFIRDLWRDWGETFDFVAWMNGLPNDQLRAEQAFVRLWAGLWPDLAKTFWPRESVHP